MIITLDANITLNTDQLPDEVLQEIISQNRFDNPIYRSNEINHRSNFGIDSSITTYELDGSRLILPRGCMRNILKTFNDNKIKWELEDRRSIAPCSYPERINGITLRPYQARAVEEAMVYDQGTITAPTGSGKTLMALEIIRRRGQKALIILHRADLAKQWIEVVRERLSIEAGLIGDGRWDIGSEITVAMIQSLSVKEQLAKELAVEFGIVLVDETHHVPAETFTKVLGWFPAKYRFGLSATVERRDGLEQMIYRSVGPCISTIERNEVQENGGTVPARVKAVETGFSPSCNSWHDYLEQLASCGKRNELIIQIAAKQSLPVLVICDRVHHAQNISDMLSRRNIDHVLAHGQVKDRDEIMDRIKCAKLTIATTSLIGEGVDVSIWGVLIMASPISSEIRLLQAIGRVVRASTGKEIALVYDLRDDCGFSGSSFKKRLEIYKKNKIWVEFSNKKAA